MSTFEWLELESSYSTSTHNLVSDFYEPCLSRAVRYDRSTGYFSSALLSLLPLSYADFIERGGKVRILCSPQLTHADFEVVTNLYQKVDDIQTLLGNLRQLVESKSAEKQLLARIFSALLASGVLEMRIAKTDLRGIFHDKKGIFEDEEGNWITFIGSANETAAAWSGFVNHEDIEVFTSLEGGDKARAANHVMHFEDLWEGRRKGVHPIDVRSAQKEIYEIVAPEPLSEILPAVRKAQRQRDEASSSSSPKILLRDYQEQALADWESNAHNGVVCFATGGGKTLTCIDAVRRWTANGLPCLILVPTEYLLHQWEAELAKWLPQAALLIVGGAGNTHEKWGKFVSPFSSASPSEIPRVIIATYASARSANFANKLRVGSHLMVAADEVHNFGSTLNREMATWLSAGAKLGMSATPERKWDDVGTLAIFDYFGRKLEPEFTLEDALDAGVLSEYDYFFEQCTLTEDEDEAWAELTQQYVQAWLAAGKKMTKRVTDILIARSRIPKAAEHKTAITVEILEKNFRSDDRWLIYCESIGHLDEVAHAIAQAKIPGLQILEYHSKNSSEHSQAIQFLSTTGGVMLAVKCLDEGVDLPRVNKAIIMASSTNPREYIQRRGRVLRRHPDKLSAQIYDILTFRAHEDAPTTCGEIERALHFSKNARNIAPSLELEAYSSTCKSKQQLPDDLEQDDDYYA